MTANILFSLRIAGESVHSDDSVATVSCPRHLNNLSERDIQDLFPFEGKWFFRVQQIRKESEDRSSYVWMDVTGSTTVPIQQSITLLVQATFLDDLDYGKAGNDAESDMIEYNKMLLSSIPRPRPDRHPVITNQGANQKTHESHVLDKLKSGVKASTNTVKTSATSVWNTLKASMTAHLSSSSSLLSDAAEENLSQLSEDLAALFTDSNQNHTALLRELWAGLFPSEGSFSRNSAVWKQAGFQNSDPTNDLKTSGILALRGMNYMAKVFPQRTRNMVMSNRDNVKSKYPFAIVGVNLTLLLAEVLNLRDQRYLSAQAGYWEMFENSMAYFEIFCALFFHIDNVWRSKNAVRSDFSRIIGETKSSMLQVLARSPKSITDFRNISEDLGMLTNM